MVLTPEDGSSSQYLSGAERKLTIRAGGAHRGSSSQAATQTSGAFQLIATSLRLKAPISSFQHVCGAHFPFIGRATSSLIAVLFGPPERRPGGGGGNFASACRALGIQSHIRLLKDLPVADVVRESEGPWRRFLDEVVGMGYQLEITEFDVNDREAPDDIALRDRMVADYAKAYLDVMLSYRQLGDILAWGMVDRYSWLTDFDPRADKSIKRGTPYDAEFRPKPLREAIAAAFQNASTRTAEQKRIGRSAAASASDVLR